MPPAPYVKLMLAASQKSKKLARRVSSVRKLFEAVAVEA